MDIVVLSYKRADHLRSVLEAVNSSGPTSLLLVSDGPRPGDEVEVQTARAVVKEFSWDCPVKLLYFNENRGVKGAITAGLDEHFKSHDFGVVLEEDCYPSADFFRFMDYCRKRYENDGRIGIISGTNFLQSFQAKRTDVLFTEGHIWGWGTWADRWNAYRRSPQADTEAARNYYGVGWPYRRMLVRKAAAGELNSWAIPWLYHLASSGSLSATPSVNLVSNVGHGPGGTHTSGRSRYGNLPLYALGPTIRAETPPKMNRAYQVRYALGLQFEHLVHTTRRPIIRLVRRIVRQALAGHTK